MTAAAEVPIPGELPWLVPKRAVLFPGAKKTLLLRSEEEIAAVDAALAGERFLALFPPGPEGEPSRRGTAARIERMRRLPDGAVRVALAGVARVDRATGGLPKEGRAAPVRVAPTPETDELVVEALRRNCLESFRLLLRSRPGAAEETAEIAGAIPGADRFADWIASQLNLSLPEQIRLLETDGARERLEELARILDREGKLIELETRIQEEVSAALGEKERENYLRERIRAIRKELGEEDERETQIREIHRRLAAVRLPEEARLSCREEIARLKRIPVQSSEFTVARNHIDWVMDLPWNALSEDRIDLDEARALLDRNHAGLENVKDRILEYLAVRKLKRDAPSPLLCFVGPPGTGKTSLGLAVAEALGRRVARLSLGGVTDEGEIRGHRRTYSGALPGRILQELRRVGVRNPVFMLDEIDKVGPQFSGDPSAPLLEVLDPEQNRGFSDHYLSLPFDLSEVFFITTANSTDTIPPGLLNRMEIVEFPGYATAEKVAIAEKHLIPKQLERHGLAASRLKIRRRAIRRIIDVYAAEAGLRDLERSIAAICRKRAAALLRGEETRVTVGEEDLEGYLGTPQYFPEIKARRPEVGTSTALAWTPAGGQILFIEATILPGRQSLQLTGQLGEVMRESAETSLSYVRSFVDRHGGPPDLLDGRDIHIHVPAGAVSKDGPSAGIAIVVALYSLLSGSPVRHDVAMTGEITLRGRVLPVGGIRQKILGAHRAGIRLVVVPARNEPELREVPEEVLRRLEIVPVEHVDEVFPIACLPKPGRR
ncbi:MAG: endopeptidase La [Candidatus Eisenbacteria bacterium]|nr:endopeptidase La [Candidatus Eisenbacteria bacterium]